MLRLNLRSPPKPTVFPYTTSSDLVGGERQRASALGNLESGGQAGHVNGDAVPTFLAPRILHGDAQAVRATDRKITRLNSSHTVISYAVFCLKKKTETIEPTRRNEA